MRDAIISRGVKKFLICEEKQNENINIIYYEKNVPSALERKKPFLNLYIISSRYVTHINIVKT